MNVQIKIFYKGQPSKAVDDEIQAAMDKIGAEWYAEGYNIPENERDICFDLKVEE